MAVLKCARDPVAWVALGIVAGLRPTVPYRYARERLRQALAAGARAWWSGRLRGVG
jgi:hypothetical protein